MTSASTYGCSARNAAARSRRRERGETCAGQALRGGFRRTALRFDREVERGAQDRIGARRRQEQACCERQRRQHVDAVELADLDASARRPALTRHRHRTVNPHRRS
jgi:hypothetical protein